MINPEEALKEGDALIIVDVQNDFCPGGALPIEEGDSVVPVLNEWLVAAKKTGIPVYASYDWHPPTHPSFSSEGGAWPPHCIQGTKGADFHSDLLLPDDVVQVAKGTRFDKDQHSAFDETGLANALRKSGIRRLWIGGLALDVCVRATALEARTAGFEAHLIAPGTRPVTLADGAAAKEELRTAGVVIEE